MVTTAVAATIASQHSHVYNLFLRQLRISRPRSTAHPGPSLVDKGAVTLVDIIKRWDLQAYMKMRFQFLSLTYEMDIYRHLGESIR